MSTAALHADHTRRFETNRFVYPVISRRAGGLSIGVNLNPDKVCNFDCIYCQVDRTLPGETRFVELERLLAELDDMLELATSGRLFQHEKFWDVEAAQRRLHDIAFSGDGEPTTYRNFAEIVEACAAVKRRRGLDHVQLIVLTNASMLHRPHVRRGLAILDANQVEIWAKLDAGTEEYFRRVARTTSPLSRILENITETARTREVVIQSLFMRLDGQPPPAPELEAYCQRLRDVAAAGGRLRLVQVYTVARRPAESCVTPLSEPEVAAIAELVRNRTGLPATAY